MSRIGGLRLASAFVRHRRAQALVLLLMGGVLAASVSGLAIVRDSAERAVVDSVRADLGQRTYALQTGNPDAIAALRLLSWAAPVEDTDGEVSAGGLSDSVTIRATTDATLRLGTVTEGARPQRAGEVLLSESTARALGVAVGDEIDVHTGGAPVRARVAGFSVDPADSTDRTLFQLVGDSAGFAPTRWLSDIDFYSEPSLRPSLDRRTATYRSIGPLLESAELNRPEFLSAMRFLPAGAGLLMAVVLLSALVVMSRLWRSYADALTAAGMPPALAWRRIFAIVFGLVLIGELAGGVLTAATLGQLRTAVSGWFGQRWVQIALPVTEPLLVAALTLVAAAVAVQVVRHAPALTAWAVARRRREFRWATPAALVSACAAAIVWALALRTLAQSAGDGTDRIAAVSVVVAGTVLATALPFLLSPLAGIGLPPVTRAVLRHVLGGLLPVVAVAAAIVFASGMWSARTTYEANVGEAYSSPLEPAGSFVISAMPNAAIDTLTTVYRSRGGGEVLTFQIPDETTAALRVTGTSVVECMSRLRTTDPADLPESCFPTQAASSLNQVMIGLPGSAPRADPRLLKDGKVGLLFFPADSGAAARLATTAAEPDPNLGGNVPGLVVPPDSNLVKEFTLAPGGTSQVVLLGFTELTPHDRVFMRATALRLASGAETADGTDPTAYDRLRSVANTVGTLGALTAGVVLLLGGLAMVVAHELVRRTLVDLGAAAGPRWRLMGRLAAAPVLALALTVPLSMLTAAPGRPDAIGSYGLLWLLPAAFALLAVAAVVVAFLRVPRRPREAMG